MKDFTQLSQRECSEVYKSMLENSMKKIESASVIAKADDFGTALSIQIVGLEEAIKAIFIYLDSLGFKFRQVKGMKSLFTNHELRYFFSVIFIISDVILKDFRVILRKVIKYFKAHEKEFIENNAQFREKNKDGAIKYFFEVVIPHIQDRIIHVLNEIESYKQFDKQRQDGLYVDYECKLRTPSDISEEFYNEVVCKVSKVTSLIHKFIEELEDNKADYNEAIKVQIDLIKKHNGYELFATILRDIKSQRRTPLEHLELKMKQGELEMSESKDDWEKTIMTSKN